MYRNNTLTLPKLVPCQDLPTAPRDNDLNFRSLYRLDHWREPAPGDLPQLPEKYQKFLDSQVYAITAQYMQEITRTAAMGQLERNIERPFDTAVRDFCTEPSRAFFEVSFRLIADCVYDPQTGKRPQDPLRFMLPQMMLYRLWQYQTGSGLPWFFSGLAEMETRQSESGMMDLRSHQSCHVEFLADMKAHDEAIRSQHAAFAKARVNGKGATGLLASGPHMASFRS